MTAEPEPERQSETLQQRKLSLDYLNIPKYLLVSASQMFRFSVFIKWKFMWDYHNLIFIDWMIRNWLIIIVSCSSHHVISRQVLQLMFIFIVQLICQSFFLIDQWIVKPKSTSSNCSFDQNSSSSTSNLFNLLRFKTEKSNKSSHLRSWKKMIWFINDINS